MASLANCRFQSVEKIAEGFLVDCNGTNFAGVIEYLPRPRHRGGYKIAALLRTVRLFDVLSTEFAPLKLDDLPRLVIGLLSADDAGGLYSEVDSCDLNGSTSPAPASRADSSF